MYKTNIADIYQLKSLHFPVRVCTANRLPIIADMLKCSSIIIQGIKIIRYSGNILEKRFFKNNETLFFPFLNEQ